MNVVFVGPYDFPHRNAAAQMVDALAGQLTSCGHTVHVVGRVSKIPLSDPSATASLEGGATLSLPGDAQRPRSVTTQLSMLREVVAHLDSRQRTVVVAYNPSSMLLALLLVAVPLKGGRLVSHCTEWYANPPLVQGVVIALLKRADIALRMRILQKMTSGLIVSSSFLRRYYRRQQTLLMPTLVPAPILNSESVGQGRARLIYAGIPFPLGAKSLRGDQMKDRLDQTIQILSELASEGLAFDFHVFGLTQEEYVQAVPQHESLVANGGEWLAFAGRISPDELAERYAQADFSVLLRDPTRTTLAGSPTKLTESILAGVPPLMSDVGDAGMYIHHMSDGVLLPLVREEAKTAIRAALNLAPDELSAMRRATLDRREQLLPAAWGSRLEQFLEARLGGQQP